MNCSRLSRSLREARRGCRRSEMQPRDFIPYRRVFARSRNCGRHKSIVGDETSGEEVYNRRSADILARRDGGRKPLKSRWCSENVKTPRPSTKKIISPLHNVNVVQETLEQSFSFPSCPAKSLVLLEISWIRHTDIPWNGMLSVRHRRNVNPRQQNIYWRNKEKERSWKIA